MKNQNPNSADEDSPRTWGRRQFLAAGATMLAAPLLSGVTVRAQSRETGAPAAAASPSSTPLGSGNGPYPTQGMAGYSETSPLELIKFQRRALGPKDVAIKIHYCGVCHSDIHTVRGDWGKIQFPQIVGHELAGEVVAVGSSVNNFTIGNRVGVGTMVNSCRICPECHAGHENYCLNGNTQTYGSKDKDGTITQGGYSTFVVVDEDFVINIPDAIDLADAGPLLCAGIT